MFYNPYVYGVPNVGLVNRIGGIGGLFRNINWSSMLTNTSKTLDVINQAIPIVTQVKPIINNAKTMFKIVDAINSDDTKLENNDEQNETTNTNGPLFFI